MGIELAPGDYDLGTICATADEAPPVEHDGPVFIPEDEIAFFASNVRWAARIRDRHAVRLARKRLGATSSRRTAPRRRGAGRPASRRAQGSSSGDSDPGGDDDGPGEARPDVDHRLCADPRRCNHWLRFPNGPWTCEACHPREVAVQ